MSKPSTQDKICIVYLTTFPPRECGIATFSADLVNYSDELFLGKVDTRVVAMNTSGGEPPRYGEKIIFQISQNERKEYESVAEELNKIEEVKLVSIQHEYGIFGENQGENLIFFLEKLKKPTVITFHTVLPNPDEKMKEVTIALLQRANHSVVMTELSKKILLEVYSAEEQKIKVIPHGIHPQLYTEADFAKKKLKLENKMVLTTFGLLSRGKGIEYAIESLPEVIKKHGDVVYLILGATHPIILRNEGEVYRNELITLAKNLGIESNVIFHNKYLSKDELLLFLEATDIYLSIPQDPNQAVSGTLSYALGSGRPVISTAFMQAKEIVTPDTGILVPFRDSKSITKNLLELLNDKKRLLSMGRAAYFSTRGMTWNNVALSYMSLYSSLLPEISEKNKYMLPIKIDHIERLTDDFGIFQFATLHQPDPQWGYTLDDNARALVALSWYNTLNPNKEVESLAEIFLSFIEKSATESGEFINYFDVDRNPHIEKNKNENLEDANARALWALSVAAGSGMPSVAERAKNLFEKQFALHENVASPRAAAFFIKALAGYGKQDVNILNLVKSYADFLVDIFRGNSDEKWKWFEDSLTYSNAVLPEALLTAYEITENTVYFETAKSSLDFLLEHSFEGDICVPVGQAGWFKKGKKKQRYDQQPEEVSSLILALHRMNMLVKEEKYEKKMMLAFDWFFGNNSSRQAVYTHLTGGSYDGIGEAGINLNQGAESTIAYLLARLTLELTEK